LAKDRCPVRSRKRIATCIVNIISKFRVGCHGFSIIRVVVFPFSIFPSKKRALGETAGPL
jgi:hypothetical protein